MQMDRTSEITKETLGHLWLALDIHVSNMPVIWVRHSFLMCYGNFDNANFSCLYVNLPVHLLHTEE